jgi:hypothetical protein
MSDVRKKDAPAGRLYGENMLGSGGKSLPATPTYKKMSGRRINSDSAVERLLKETMLDFGRKITALNHNLQKMSDRRKKDAPAGRLYRRIL